MKTINLIQTGGTIAMSLVDGKAEMDPQRWATTLYEQIPELRSVARLHPVQLFLEDSSDIGPMHWEAITRHILSNRSRFDGFVVLHGTDTMAYTASALSFTLRGLGKPVIFTGSQVPLSSIRSDAKRNLVNAVELATMDIGEVAICFHDTLYRGNRATKMNIGDFNAFESPNLPPIARIGLHIDVRRDLLWEQPDIVEDVDPARDEAAMFSDRLLLVKLHPGLPVGQLEALPVDACDVLIIEAFGSGNLPSKGESSLLPVISSWRRQGKEIVICSQAPYDSINLNAYQSGRLIRDMGVIPAGDMTLEAAITKAMYILALPDGRERFKNLFLTSLAGELTH